MKVRLKIFSFCNIFSLYFWYQLIGKYIISYHYSTIINAIKNKHRKKNTPPIMSDLLLGNLSPYHIQTNDIHSGVTSPS
jgi:hypothetical protein